MSYLKIASVKSLRLFRDTNWLVALVTCIIFGMAEYSCAIGDTSNTTRMNNAPNPITEENASPIVETAEPVSRSLDQIKKDESHYSQPSTTREIPFRPTMDQEAYRKAKEKAWQDQFKPRQGSPE